MERKLKKLYITRSIKKDKKDKEETQKKYKNANILTKSLKSAQ